MLLIVTAIINYCIGPIVTLSIAENWFHPLTCKENRT